MENERREKRMTLGGLLLAQRRRLTGFAAATVVLSVAAPLKSFIMQWLIDAGSREQALGAMGLGILVVLVSHLAELLCRNSFSTMATQAVCRARCRVMERLSRRSMKAYLQGSTGEMQSCLTNEMKQLGDDYYMGIFNICIWGGMAVSALVMMALISPVLLVLAVVLCLVPLMIPKLMANALGQARTDWMRDTAAYTGRVGELLRGFEALLSAGGLGYMVRSHGEAAERNRRCDLRLRRVMNRGMVITSLGLGCRGCWCCWWACCWCSTGG